jgi:ABC-type glycerol-3-phosphate transport system substrate-binding protein
MRKRNSVIFCLVLLFVLVSPGFMFGSGNTSRSSGSTGRVAIDIWGPVEGSIQDDVDAYNIYVQEYRKRYPNVDLTIITNPRGIDYRQRYDMALMAGNPPAAWAGLPPVDIPTRAKNGTIKDITDLVNNWDLKKQGLVNTTFDEANMINGRWYAIPDTVYTAGTPYNRNNLRAGGADPNNLPKTWQEFAQVGQRVTDPSVPRFGYLLVGMEWNAWPFTPWVWSAGGEMVRPNSDGSYRIAFNETPGVDAAEFWNRMVWQYRMTQRDVLQNWEANVDDMASGRGVFAYATLENYTGEAREKYGIPVETFGIIPIPGKDNAGMQKSLAGGEVWIFPPHNSEAQTKAGWDFAMIQSYDPPTLEASWAFWSAPGKRGIDTRIPGRTDMVETKFQKYGTSWPSGWAAEFAALSKVAKLEPYCPNWDDLKNTLAPYLQQIILKEGITRTEIQSILNAAANECYTNHPNSFKRN